MQDVFGDGEASMRVTVQFWRREPTDIEDAHTCAREHGADFFIHGIGVYRVVEDGYPPMMTHRDNFSTFMEDVVNGRRS